MSKHVLQVGASSIKTNEEGMISLNDIFDAAKKAGMADGKNTPSEWSRFGGKEIVEFAIESLNTCKSRIIKSTRGKGGGTFAHMNIALAYAKYLSPELHYQVNETFIRAKSGDVSLADEIVDKAKPEDVQKHLVRTASKVTRNEFTKTLSLHNVYGAGFAICTNSIYRPLLGGDATEIRQQRNLPTKANVRESMTAQEIILTAHAEMLATRDIRSTRASGNEDCAQVCERAARRVASL